MRLKIAGSDGYLCYDFQVSTPRFGPFGGLGRANNADKNTEIVPKKLYYGSGLESNHKEIAC